MYMWIYCKIEIVHINKTNQKTVSFAWQSDRRLFEEINEIRNVWQREKNDVALLKVQPFQKY